MSDVAWVKSSMRRFGADTAGSVTAFTAVIFLMLVVGAGMAVDFMRHEAHRVELQDALDRGVLAAAALDQVQPAEDTIRGYLKTTAFVGDDYALKVSENSNATARQVTAAAEIEIRTYFLKIIGRPSLKVTANGSAYESRQDIEVSLVLDISTSMSGCRLDQVPCTEEDMDFTGFPERSRLDQMKDDASRFVDLMVNDRTNGYLTMSVVPFGGQVNPGSAAFDYLNGTAVHPYSNCVEFSSAQFQSTAMPTAGTSDQMPYFSFSAYYLWPDLDPTIEYGWCPPGDAEKIMYHSDDADALKRHITGLRTHEGTGSQYGMKWGVMLLDPSSSALSTQLAAAGEINQDYKDRPGAYDTEERMKVVVFMSDGNTTEQIRVNPTYYNEAVERDWWATNVPTWDTPYTYNELLMPSTPAETARSEMTDSCDAARAKGIIVFTIGFGIEDGSDAQTDLAACASKPGYFYDVDGGELREAFEAIAATIQKLKLIN